MSGVLLTPDATESSEIVAALVGTAVDEFGRSGGPGAVILAGDLIDLSTCDHLDPGQAFASHPRLLTALRRYAALGPDHQVVMLAGAKDAAVLGDGIAARRIDEYGFRRAASLELIAECGSGERKILIEHPAASLDGDDRHDPACAPEPTSAKVPTAGHRALPGWLAGADRLLDRTEAERFVASRILYQRLLKPIGLAVIAIAVAAIVLAVRSEHASGHYLASALLALGATIIFASNRAVARTARRWSGATGDSATDTNRSGRDQAERLAAGGWTGLISGGTRRPELSELSGDCFYANCGASIDGIVGLPARFGFPPVFGPVRQVSWVELESAAELQVRLVVGRSPTSGPTLVEAVLRRSSAGLPRLPTVVAEAPRSATRMTPSTWSAGSGDGPSRTLRVRRRAEAGLAAAGVVNLVSALTPPVAERIETLTHWVPLTVEQTATALTTLIGIALLLLARGVRRGQRRAWLVACALLVFSTVLHVLKGLDTEEAVATAILLAYFLTHFEQFAAPVDRAATRRAVILLPVVVVAATAFGVAVAHLGSGMASRLPLPRVSLAILERLVGVTSISLGRAGRFLDPSLAAVGFGSVVLAGWSLLRPRRPMTGLADARDSLRAHQIVASSGGDTLAYFALRHDKQWFFWRQSLVAYSVRFGVCVVSPDPIGPLAERDEVWSEFERFAHGNGWSIAVMGAAAEWLPTYRSSGMRDLYIGDEAIVDCSTVTLEGGHHKGLRNTINKIARKGYTVEFFDPAEIDDGLRRALAALMTQSRRGEVERGFSMTLGRIFDPADVGLLLAVCFNASREPVAFCHYTPAPKIDGYSLDLMRRSETDTTNGLTDFVVLKTIRHLAELGRHGLGLNFATMRAVLAGEISDSPLSRIQRVVVGHLSASMQIESLWRYNAKFDPEWYPRFALFESLDHLLPAALAVASVESWWELPVIGRFLVRPPVAVPAEPDD